MKILCSDDMMVFYFVSPQQLKITFDTIKKILSNNFEWAPLSGKKLHEIINYFKCDIK